ncbi:MAG: putative toxin-antitoxin system toxin component, PIN family [Candidatus Blackburnbacteria bacterium]|nr:putative toxin-antitoxin system toxin component, PIN family [Candidatus Blackburnbacteria bacterium]
MSKRRPRVVLDTNIIISAVVFGGIPRKIIQLQAQKKIKVFISPAIMEELSRVLVNKFHYSRERLAELQERLEKSTTSVIPSKQVKAIKGDEVDNRILEAAVEADADYIISGDKKHILPLKKFGRSKIVTPTQLLAALG